MNQPVIEWPTVRERLRALMLERGVSIGQLSAWTGIHRSTISGALNVNADTQWYTVVRILAALGLDLIWVHNLGAPKGKKRAARATKKTPKRHEHQ